MNLLGAKLYDPGTAASQVTTSLLAMTALDVTNLRISFTVPAHGFVKVKQSIVHHGSTTTAQVLLGILEGATVRARVAGSPNLLGTAVATTQTRLEADYTVSGLTPGAVNWDFAVGVEIVSSAGGALKWGGPNNTTTNDAFGAVVFEIWDPQPMATAGQLSIDSNGRVDVIKIAGTTQTARDIGASVLLAANQHVIVDSGTVTTVTNQLTAAQIATGVWQDTTSGDFTTALSIGKSIMNGVTLGTGLTVNDITTKTGYSLAVAPPTAATIASAVWQDTTAGDFTTALSVGKSVMNGVTLGTGLTVNALTTNNDKTGYALSSNGIQAIWDALTSALTTVSSIGKLLVDNINATITSRMASYTQPTGFLSATFSGTIANTTNITAGTITTTTNLTNAPTNGDFTADMKTSLNAATPAVTVSDKTDFSLTAEYDPAKTAAQAGDAMTLTAGERTSVGTAVWASATRTLTSFGTLVADVATAVWGAAARTLTAFGFTVDTNTNSAETAIQAKTDQLVFTVANQVDANTQSINDTTITGDGQPGTEFGV